MKRLPISPFVLNLGLLQRISRRRFLAGAVLLSACSLLPLLSSCSSTSKAFGEPKSIPKDCCVVHLTRKGSLLGAGASLRIIDEGQVVDQGRPQAKQEFQWYEERPEGSSSKLRPTSHNNIVGIALPSAREQTLAVKRQPLYILMAAKGGGVISYENVITASGEDVIFQYLRGGTLERRYVTAEKDKLKADGYSVSLRKTGNDLLTFSSMGTKVGDLGFNGELTWCRKAGPYRLLWMCQKDGTCGVISRSVTLQPGKKYHFSLEPVWLDAKNVAFGTTQLRLVSIEPLNR